VVHHVEVYAVHFLLFDACVRILHLLVLEVGTSLILQPWRRNWNFGPMNSPPLSCTHLSGHGYRDNQTCVYFFAMCADVLSSILTSSTRLEIVSMIINALNSYGFSLTWMIHGPMRSTVHSSNGIIHTSCSGRFGGIFMSSHSSVEWG
jgi:hypothetical protein